MVEILRNLIRRKLRSALTISGIVIGIFALTTLGAMTERLNQQLDGGVQFYGSKIQVGAPEDQQVGLLPLSTIATIKTIAGVDAVFPSFSFLVHPGSFAFGSAPESIVNYDPEEAKREQPQATLAQGRTVSLGPGMEVVLGSTLAREFKKKVGDAIDLPVAPADASPSFVHHSFTVVGILNPTGTAPDGIALVSPAGARVLLADSLPPPIRNSVDLTQIAPGFLVYGKAAASLHDLDQIATEINAQVPGVKAIKPSIPVTNFKSFVALFTAITTAAGILAVVIGGLSVINTMIMAVGERVREIGLKRAVGAYGGDILREFLTEAGLIGLIGGTCGYLVGVGLTSLMNASGTTQLFLITPRLTVLVIGFAVLLSMVAGILPALRAARLDPVTALRTAN